jgi:hypothetical protein
MEAPLDCTVDNTCEAPWSSVRKHRLHPSTNEQGLELTPMDRRIQQLQLTFRVNANPTDRQPARSDSNEQVDTDLEHTVAPSDRELESRCEPKIGPYRARDRTVDKNLIMPPAASAVTDRVDPPIDLDIPLPGQPLAVGEHHRAFHVRHTVLPQPVLRHGALLPGERPRPVMGVRNERFDLFDTRPVFRPALIRLLSMHAISRFADSA